VLHSTTVAKFFRRLSTYDVAPEFSRRVRRVALSPLGVLVIGISVAVLVGLVVHPRVFALAGGLGLVAAAGVCWPWLTIRGVRAVVAFDRPRTNEGTEVGLSASLTNHLPWPAWGLTVRDPKADSTVRLPTVAGRTKSVYRWTFVPPVRGEYPTETPVIGTAFPFGLSMARRTATVAGTLLVWPKTFPVGPVPSMEGDDVTEGAVARNKVGTTGDILGLRPYRRGDSPRRIHWSQTAKHDRLVVCEVQSNSRPVVLLVLDHDAGVHTAGADGTHEWAIRTLASLTKGWIEAGAQVGAVWGERFIAPQAGGDQIVRILDELARVGSGGRPLREVLAEKRVRAVRSAIRVVVTSDVGFHQSPNSEGLGNIRWVVLHREGFGNSADRESLRTSACDGGPPRRRSGIWLEIPSVDELPHRLRHGTAEASHGS